MNTRHMSADERDARANSRDAQIDADTTRRQAERLRGLRKRLMLIEAEKLELLSAGWLSQAHQAQETV